MLIPDAPAAPEFDQHTTPARASGGNQDHRAVPAATPVAHIPTPSVAPACTQAEPPSEPMRRHCGVHMMSRVARLIRRSVRIATESRHAGARKVPPRGFVA